MYHSWVQSAICGVELSDRSSAGREGISHPALVILLPLSRLRGHGLAQRRRARLRGATLTALTLQRRLALRIWLTLRILLTWLRVLLALLLV